MGPVSYRNDDHMMMLNLTQDPIQYKEASQNKQNLPLYLRLAMIIFDIKVGLRLQKSFNFSFFKFVKHFSYYGQKYTRRNKKKQEETRSEIV